MLKEMAFPKTEVNGELAKDPNDYDRLGVPFPDPKPKQSIDFSQFVMSETSADMEAKMLADKFVLGRLAILGQWTVFYGGPNVGKTLLVVWLLIQRIKAGDVKGIDVFYINADDFHKGLVEKKKLAEQYGFNMLVPGRNNFKAKMLPEILAAKSQNDTASGCIVILDTLKKFTDLMSKREGSQFGEAAREFVSAGGTIISLAHVNKHKNDDGESVYAGTSDVVDDADCAYILDLIEDNGTLRIVQFRNIKDRGDVDQLAQYGYKSKLNQSVTYSELFESVQEIGQDDVKKAQQRAAIEDRLAINHEVIMAVLAAIKDGNTTQKEIVKSVMETTGTSRRKIIQVLKVHSGTNRLQGHRWSCTQGDHNAYVFSAL